MRRPKEVSLLDVRQSLLTEHPLEETPGVGCLHQILSLISWLPYVRDSERSRIKPSYMGAENIILLQVESNFYFERDAMAVVHPMDARAIRETN